MTHGAKLCDYFASGPASAGVSTGGTSVSAAPAYPAQYEKRKKVGEGTYAVVYEAWSHAPTPSHPHGRRVAIKKLKMGTQASGFDVSAIREIKYLQELRHANILELLDVFVHKQNLNLVLEYLDADLEDVIKDKELVIAPGDIKCWIMMTLRGLQHCHKHWVLHRVKLPIVVRRGQSSTGV